MSNEQRKEDEIRSKATSAKYAISTSRPRTASRGRGAIRFRMSGWSRPEARK
jgi:hypothetical protein